MGACGCAPCSVSVPNPLHALPVGSAVVSLEEMGCDPEALLPRGTRGVVTRVARDWYWIRFEDRAPSRFPKRWIGVTYEPATGVTH